MAWFERLPYAPPVLVPEATYVLDSPRMGTILRRVVIEFPQSADGKC
jgi:hypothetical protein